jgi:hypothetical protein
MNDFRRRLSLDYSPEESGCWHGGLDNGNCNLGGSLDTCLWSPFSGSKFRSKNFRIYFQPPSFQPNTTDRNLSEPKGEFLKLFLRLQKSWRLAIRGAQFSWCLGAKLVPSISFKKLASGGVV